MFPFGGVGVEVVDVDVGRPEEVGEIEEDLGEDLRKRN